EAGVFADQANLLHHVGGLCVFDGRIDFRRLVERVEQRIAARPRFRQVPVALPFGIGRPTWEDDPHFDLLSHVRRAEVPPPGGDHELREAASEFWSRKLDRTKPLWDATVLDGVAGERSAILFKAHRALVKPRDPALASLFLDRASEADANGVP